MLLCFIKEWLENPGWWFNPIHSFDRYITDKYECILDIYIKPVEDIEKRALCIAYDQLPYHIFRGQPSNHIIQYFQHRAINIYDTLTSLDDVHGHELCFLLLPLRHSNNPHNIFKALNIIWGKICESDIETNITIYKKFLRASYKRCPILSGGNWDILGLTQKLYVEHILDFKGSANVDKPFIAQHPIVEVFSQHIYQDKDQFIISLSGGVDSMVGAYIASHTLGHEKCCYVHINYNNRDTSQDEEMFVRYWSSKWGVRLYVRKLHEINRPLCMKYDMREVYETYTRNIRYACYKEASLDENPNVILLHNKDDCFENILTNITHKNKYDNLLGMTYTSKSIQDGICFIRPFLDISKKQLVEYAHSVGIPYLYDSTPKWSQRGQIRDNIVPTISSWNTGCIPAFFDLSLHLQSLHTIVDDYVDMMLKDVIKTGQEQDHIEIRGVKELPKDITVWRKIIAKLDLPQPSYKSIQMFLKKKGGRGHLSKTLDVEFSDEVIIFKKSIGSLVQ